MKKLNLLVSAVLLSTPSLLAQTNPTTQTLPYNQDFSTLAHAATTYPAGWQSWTVANAPAGTFNTVAPVADRSLVANSAASINSGNVHNYNGKIGFLNTGSLDLSLVLALNTTNKHNVKVDYDVMTVRNPYDTTTNTRINEVTLQYRVGTTGSFITLTGIEYQNNSTTQTSSGVTTPQKQETRTITLPAACDNQPVVQLRWISRQISGGGARPSFAIDNVIVDTLSEDLSIATTNDASEGLTPTSGSFVIKFTPITADTTTFNYTINGSATLNADYTVSLSGGTTPLTLTTTSGTVTVPSGTGAIIATINPLNDAISEGLETVTMSLSAPSGNYTISRSIATVNIHDDEATLIHTIQGTGSTATAGTYTVEGIVTGVYPTLSPAGFYMQEEDTDRDNDPNTSEGIFIVSNATVYPGDKVRVSGTALEGSAAPSYQQAVLNNTTVTTVSTHNQLPAVSNITLPLVSVADYEKYEGMLVRFTDTLVVTDNYNLPRYGEVSLSKGGMLYQPTQIIDPNDVLASGVTASGASNVVAITAMAKTDSLRTILLDDGRGSMTNMLPFVNNDYTLRLGSTVQYLTGVMGFAFSRYRIQPLANTPPTFNYAPRPITVPSVGANANVKVASFNVLNYFNGTGHSQGFPTARGAHSVTEFNRQRDKIIAAISAINADIVGLIEMENDGIGANSAIQDLVDGLNAKMGAGTYSIIDDGATVQSFCTDAIRCGIIYKSSVVTPHKAAMISSNSVFNRPPLAQTFKVKSTGMSFNYIINHFKSKSCSGSTGGDIDQLDGQACYNETRRKQAGELIQFIKNTVIPTSGSSLVLSMGDYNAYFEEDPLDSFRSAGYTVLGAGTGYSYLFNGLVGSLDNAVVTDSLLAKVTGIAKWNINSAEPTHLDYNDSTNDGNGDFANAFYYTYTPTPFRSSDHDPVIVGLDLSKPSKPNGIASFSNNASFNIYPNPASSLVYIDNLTNTSAKCEIVNSIGQTLINEHIPVGTTRGRININSLSTGVYTLRMLTDEGVVEIQKLVKQ